MPLYYTRPAGTYSTLYRSMLDAGHLLIAGATGSGKSTVINGLIHTALYLAPSEVEFILIDPKRVDMLDYAKLPHTLRYATERPQIVDALQYAIAVMEARYTEMSKRKTKEYNGSMLYVIIDEAADLLVNTADKRVFAPMIQRLAQLGRAAHVTVILATQCCLASILTTAIKCNFSSRLALHTATAQDSRNIIEMKGAETLPDPRQAGFAHGIWRNGAETTCYILPRYEEPERARLIQYWKKNKRPRFSLFGKVAS